MQTIEMILASHNQGKIFEMQELINNRLNDIQIKLFSLQDMGYNNDIEEPFDTCEENARIKAVTIFEKFNIPSLADDSGIFVDYLNGAPGVYSARYAGVGNTADACIDKLLEKLKDAPDEKRTAQFKCVLCCVLGTEDDKIFYSRGICTGVILHERNGNEGFGYDPIFFYPPVMKSFAQLNVTEKNKYSHRALAVEEFAKNIVKYIL